MGKKLWPTSWMMTLIMPNLVRSESLFHFGNNSYAKPATALNILRETIMGRELFDFAFKEYSKRWMFKHPTPEDFFRTMEDASGVDLDWFWRGWFYTTDYVDISIDAVKWFQADTLDPHVEKPFQKEQEENAPPYVSSIRDREDIEQTWVEGDTAARDFYYDYDPYEVTDFDLEEHDKFYASLDIDQKELLKAGYNYYEVSFSNRGGLVMPMTLEVVWDDNSKEIIHIPVEIWRFNDNKVKSVLFSKKQLQSIHLDPLLETADVDMNNNFWPPRVIPTRFELFKEKQEEEKNPMQQRQKPTEEKKETEVSKP